MSTNSLCRAHRELFTRCEPSSPYVLSGLVTCGNCGRPLSASEAKGGRYTYYVCQSLLKRGSGDLRLPTPELKALRTPHHRPDPREHPEREERAGVGAVAG